MLVYAHCVSRRTRSTWQRVRGRYWLTCIPKSSCWLCKAAASSNSVDTLGSPSTPALSNALILA